MNLFDEFFAIVRELQMNGVKYAVVGGIAMAFHDQPRFTRDIDILVAPRDRRKLQAVLEHLGYFEGSKPWMFKKGSLSLHRFVKTQKEDFLVVDVLFGSTHRLKQVIENAVEQPWAAGVVRVARKTDIVWMKKLRASEQDLVDIGRLKRDKD
ncbi:MAG: nucleotidyltransferase family protein [Planctomycetota bacterium]|nr:nucleotidyltransferase family protein [Planctomycetota bacterium]